MTLTPYLLRRGARYGTNTRTTEYITSDLGCLRRVILGYFIVLKSGKMLEYNPLGAKSWEAFTAGGCWWIWNSLSISSSTTTRVEEEGDGGGHIYALVYNQWAICTTCSINMFMGSGQHRWKHCISNSNILKMVKAHNSLSNAATDLEGLFMHISMREY